jgi:glutathione S-transferase
MLTVHHLGRSQSERIVWLCEELGLGYALKRYDRRADNRMAPPDYKALHPIGAAPVITDGDLTLAESGAVVEYIIHTYGGGRLAVAPGKPHYTDYLYWFHFANGTLQPLMLRMLTVARFAPPADHPAALMARERFDLILGALDARLAAAHYLAGPELTAADIMAVFSVTTLRVFYPFSLAPFPNILAWLQRVGTRPAYQRAMAKAEPGWTPLLGAEV